MVHSSNLVPSELHEFVHTIHLDDRMTTAVDEGETNRPAGTNSNDSSDNKFDK